MSYHSVSVNLKQTQTFKNKIALTFVDAFVHNQVWTMKNHLGYLFVVTYSLLVKRLYNPCRFIGEYSRSL